MKRLVVGCWLLAVGGWGMSALAGTFPYVDPLTERYSLGAAEVSSFTTPVTANGTKMQATEHVAVIETEVADFCASDDENWAAGVSAVLPAQAVLSMKLENGTPVWMGYTGDDSWVSLAGRAAQEGAWSTKIEIDYSVSPHLVRYSVKAAGESAYTVLTSNDQDWLVLNGTEAKAGDVKLYGCGEINSLTGLCGTRPLEAQVTASESYDMNYGNLKVDASVSDVWGAETFDVVLKDANGQQLASRTAAVASGRLVADFSDVAVPGGTYSYSVVLSGAGQQGVEAKGRTDVELFANVNWFGFQNGALDKASRDANADIVSDVLVQKTDATAEGKILPTTHASDGATVTTVSRLVVNGIYTWPELTQVAAAGQFAIAPCRLDNSDDPSVLKDRAWAYRAGSGAWTTISAANVPTANGSYDVKVVFDFAAKKGNCWIKLSTEGDAAYRRIVTDFALTDTKVSNAAIIGGGISELNASFKTTAPVEVLPTGNTIVIDKNAEVRLENLMVGTVYAVQGASGRAHLRWTDAKGADAKWAKVQNGQLKAVDGAPANGMDSFKSHVLGLDPEDAQSKPFLAAEQNAEPDKLVLKLPKVRQRDPSQTGVAVTYRLVTSGDPSFATGTVDKEVTDVPAGEGPTFTTELPTSGGKVRYYRVEIELGK